LLFCMIFSKGELQPLGPLSGPIVGFLFYLEKSPHCSMEELAKKYRPIMYLQLGYILGSCHNFKCWNGHGGVKDLWCRVCIKASYAC